MMHSSAEINMFTAACVVQLFYVWRIHKLQGVLRNRVMGLLVISTGILVSLFTLMWSYLIFNTTVT